MAVTSVGFRARNVSTDENDLDGLIAKGQAYRRKEKATAVVMIEDTVEKEFTLHKTIGKIVGAAGAAAGGLALTAKKTNILKPKGKGRIQEIKNILNDLGLEIADKAISAYKYIRKKMPSLTDLLPNVDRKPHPKPNYSNM